MTVPVNARRAGPYTGNSVAIGFGFGFKVFAATDVQVVVTVAGVDTVLASGYSVALNGDQENNPGGTVTYPLTGSPISSEVQLTILSNVPASQAVDFPEGGRYYAATTENAVDKVTVLVQQTMERLARTLQLSPTVTGTLQLPPPAPGYALVWNEDGDGFDNGAAPANTTVQLPDFAEATSLMAYIDPDEWPAILNYTSTFDCTTAINAWLNAGGGTVPAGLFRYTGGILTQSNVRVRGAGCPRLNDTSTALVGGTIFVGTLRFNGARIDIENIGVDHGATRTAVAGDGLVLSGLSVGKYARLNNVIGLGRAADDVFHAILVEGYDTVDIDNIFGCRTWYGVALKLKKANVTRVRGYENAVCGCIVRSNTGDGICEDININGVITVGRGTAGSGSGGTDYGFYVVVDNQAVRIQCSNINATQAKQGIAWRVNANLTEFKITGAVASYCETGLYGFTGAGDLYSAQLTACTVVYCSAWAMRLEKALTIQVNGFIGVGNAGTAYRDELIRVESSVLSAQWDNIHLSENYGALGGIRLLNAHTANTLGTNLRATPWGNLPPPGYVLSTQTGLVITLSPGYAPGGRHYIVSQRGGSAGTVANIGREYSPGATRFPVNSLLVVKNDDTQPLTISATATNVVTKGGAAIVIAASGAAMFVFDSANWVEV